LIFQENQNFEGIDAWKRPFQAHLILEIFYFDQVLHHKNLGGVLHPFDELKGVNFSA